MSGNAALLASTTFVIVASLPLSPKATDPNSLIPFSATTLKDFGRWCIQFRRYYISSAPEIYVDPSRSVGLKLTHMVTIISRHPCK